VNRQPKAKGEVQHAIWAGVGVRLCCTGQFTRVNRFCYGVTAIRKLREEKPQESVRKSLSRERPADMKNRVFGDLMQLECLKDA
jgi:hypothetical protein